MFRFIPLKDFGSSQLLENGIFVEAFEECVSIRQKRMEVHRHDYVELFCLQGRGSVLIDFENCPSLEQIRDAVPEAKVEGFAGDLSTAAATEDLLKLFPVVDILVNNLGIYEPKPFDRISDDDWRHVFEVNVLSGVRLSRAYASGMKQRNWGRIIFISSTTARPRPLRWRSHVA